MANVIETSNLSLYADDTCIYFSSKNVGQIKLVLEKDLELISHWLSCNKLKLNISKCEFLLVGSRHRIKKVDHELTVSLDGKYFRRVTNAKYLGVVIDQYLDWNDHVKYIKSKVVKCLYFLKRIRQYISKNDALTFYKTIIQCHFDYCDVVWNNTGISNLEQLFLLQKRALKVILSVSRRYPTDELFCQLKVDRIAQRFQMRTILFMQKILYGTVPPYISRRFHQQVTHYVTRKSDYSLNIPRVKTNYGKRRLEYRGVIAWNNLTNEAKGTRSISSFKRLVRAYIC